VLWLAALEKVLAGKAVVSPVVLDARQAAMQAANAAGAHER